MSDYAKVNLDELEDMAPQFGLQDVLEARFARQALGAARTGLSLQRLKPNARPPFGHRHGEQEETYVVVEGGGRMKIGDEVVDLRQWDAVRVAPQAWRGAEAGPEGMTLLAFGGGAAGDTEMEQGWWAE